MTMIIPVILAGGEGRRLWPLSRKNKPKPFLKLWSSKTLLHETLERVDHHSFSKPIIVGNKNHGRLIRAECNNAKIDPLAILLEEKGTGTAGAIALAAMYAFEIDRNSCILVLSSDLRIDDTLSFQNHVLNGIKVARSGKHVLFGITPDHASPQFGYIKKGAEIHPGIYKVHSFHEKPRKLQAKEHIKDDSYCWNSGIFLFKSQTILNDINVFEPTLYKEIDLKYKKINKNNKLLFFSKVNYKSISIDHAVMERSENTTIIPVNIGWRDLGTWKSVLFECFKK